jgi:hypothetical protein
LRAPLPAKNWTSFFARFAKPSRRLSQARLEYEALGRGISGRESVHTENLSLPGGWWDASRAASSCLKKCDIHLIIHNFKSKRRALGGGIKLL